MSHMVNTIDTQNEDHGVDPEVLSREVVQLKANRSLFSSSHTLQSITQRCILAHKHLFCNLANLQPDKNPFSKISNGMKNELMGVMAASEAADEEEAEQQCLTLRLLLNSKSSSLSFPAALGPEQQAAATALWQRLLQVNPPDLRTLSVQRRTGDAPMWRVRPFLARMLPVFHDLETLALGNYECTDADLVAIAHHLPQLRVLDVSMSAQVSRGGLVALSKLAQLEELLFPLYPETNYYEGRWRGELLEWCFEVLPRLHVVAYKVSGFYEGRPLHALSTLTSQVVRTLSEPRTLALHYAALDTLNALPRHVSLREVRVLHLTHPDLEERPLAADRWPHLAHLNVHFADHLNLMRLVGGGGAGRTLQTLRVSLAGQMVPLDELLDACPALSELCVSASEAAPPAAPPRAHTLRNLRTLYLSCPAEGVGDVLVDVLRLAPQLRTVELLMVPMAEQQLRHLAFLAVSCLRQLRTFKFYRKLLDGPVASAAEALARDDAIVALGTHCHHLDHFLFVDSFLPPIEPTDVIEP